MSSEELLESYVDGSISRRDFIRRLVAGGVTIGAAVSYAHLLAPEAEARRGRPDDFYTSFDVPRFLGVRRPNNVADIVKKGVIAVWVKADRKATVHLKVDLIRSAKVPPRNTVRLAEGRVRVGTDVRVYTFGRRARGWETAIPITEKGERVLRKILKQNRNAPGSATFKVRITGLAVAGRGRKSWDQEDSAIYLRG